MFKLNIGMICAAGLGSRVRGLTEGSKEMVQVWGKPAIQHHLDMMIKCKRVNDIVIVTNSKKRDIIDYVYSSLNFSREHNLIRNPNVIRHASFMVALDKDDVSVARTLTKRVHLIILASENISQNPIESMKAAYETLGRGEFFNTDVFVSFADIVFENMSESMSKYINEQVIGGLNYVSCLSRDSEQDTLKIENCGRFTLDRVGDDENSIHDTLVTNLTSCKSGIDNVDACSHLELGFYYGSTRTLFRTQGEWVYDRMLTSLLPIHPLPIDSGYKVIDLGDPCTYRDTIDQDVSPVREVAVEIKLENE